MAIYGYCRISQKKQNIERQVRNILNVYPTAIIIREAFTGRKIEGRKEWEKIYRTVRAGDMIIFDSVSRFSRNAEEGFELYQDLYNKDVDLVFLKEPQINPETFKRALDRAIPMTGTNVDYILDGINRFLLELAKDQIRLAFEQAEKEVEDLRQRTREGIVTARLNGKQIGARPGEKRITNPNVLIELGYAVNILGWERVICLCNTDFGDAYPFDIAHDRITGYSLEGKNEKDVRNYVRKIIFSNIRDLRNAKPRAKVGEAMHILGTYDYEERIGKENLVQKHWKNRGEDTCR